MHNLDDIVLLYFKHTTAREVLGNRVSFEDYPEGVFSNKALMHITHYSDTENIGLYHYAKNNLHGNVEGYKERANVFDLLTTLTDDLLLMEQDVPVCNYARVGRWRNVSTKIGEEFLVCAFLANRRKKGYEQKHSLLWSNVIRHNNIQLNRIMEDGLAENHFHLYGSAPVFDLIWINMMNFIDYTNNMNRLREIDKGRRSGYINNYVGGEKGALEQQYLQAAFIRIILTMFLLGQDGKIDFEEILKHYHYNYSKIDYLLSRPEFLWDEVSNIRKLIDEMRNIMNVQMNGMDYAFLGPSNDERVGNSDNTLYLGDRWIIYRMLTALYCRHNIDVDNQYLYKWLYAYLLIKVDIRSELLQINETVGFENFSIYSRRKSRMLTSLEDNKRMIQSAVYNSIQTGNIKSLEIRITPGDTAKENARRIRQGDWIIKKDWSKEGLNQSNWFYYVLHFTKEKEKFPDERDYFGEKCRFHEKRNVLRKQTQGLIEFRNKYPELAERVLGIDACSQEIGCRPEVFATTFRRLGEHISEIVWESQIVQLKKTYHVGEDFLDIVDGLRAIDESIRFLNLQCGDRIGHGTVLGINVPKWYHHKRYTIIISQQDYLDNIVWLYHKLGEFQIENTENLKSFLLAEFEINFSQLYEPYIDKEDIRKLYHSMRGGIRRKEPLYQFNIHNYYEAWKLRGDEPMLYVNGYLDANKRIEYDYSAINEKYKDTNLARQNLECTLLYYYYHFSWKIRKKGNEMREIRISQSYIDGVEKVQKAMQQYIGIMGIGIESNPTSNFLISTISSYAEHPLLQFYNKDLTSDPEEIRECPQLFVSVNTDDKGVFQTSLENEYALLAHNVEGIKDSKGQPRYNRQMIYQWLDNIRIMGMKQSFQVKGKGNSRNV